MATKQQVASAARGLFAAHGYVGTTIAAIADAADIPEPTIYSAFGTKAKILQAIAVDVVRSQPHQMATVVASECAGCSRG